jgi:photosystem I subunit 8
LAVISSVVAVVAAPAEAANVVSTLASATEGYPFVPPEWAPSVLVPLTGLVIPAVAMASLFVYIQKEAPK